jgi:hypothetical protein
MAWLSSNGDGGGGASHNGMWRWRWGRVKGSHRARYATMAPATASRVPPWLGHHMHSH